jgi:hypothetical protein
MNRAWIPAGALASVSVAGLIALGPLTDSMGTKVSFPTSVSAPDQSGARTTVLPVRIDYSIKGTTDTETAALTRGGEAAAATSANSDAGRVGYRVRSSGTATAKTKTTKVKTKAPAKQKRQTSIGTSGESNNGDSGLTGVGSSGSPQLGEQGTTLGSDAP